MVLNNEKERGARKPKPRGWGLPGGHTKEDESPRDAASRELWEEAWVHALLSEDPILTIPQGKNHTVMVFLGTNPVGKFKPQDPDILAVDWVDWTLLSPGHSFYGNYKGEKVYDSHIEYIYKYVRKFPLAVKNA